MSTKDERLKALSDQEQQLRSQYKQKLAAVSRRRRAIEYSAQKAHRKAETQAKIVFGAGAKEYLDTHPRDQWFRQFMRDFLKASPTVKINAVLAQWAKTLDEGKQSG
jgi:hypothetical protein